jgi:hypothetical protein
MHKIVARLQIGDNGPEVSNLKGVLSLLIDRGKLPLAVAKRNYVLKILKPERGRQLYRDSTTLPLVRAFQTQYHFAPGGNVDPKTADALNAVLKELGAIDSSPPTSFKVSGHATHADGTQLGDVIVTAADRDLRDEPLGEATTDASGYYEIAKVDRTYIDKARHFEGHEVYAQTEALKSC